MCYFTNILALWSPGWVEWTIILVIALLIFGRRLPEVGRNLGRSLLEFKKGIGEAKNYKDDIKKQADDIKNDIVNDINDTTALNDKNNSD